MPLNQVLFQALRTEFGDVVLAHDGEEMELRYVKDYTSHPPHLRLQPPPHGYGEYYRINCPFCGDTRSRLWINHRWGVWDKVTSSYNTWLAHCFNEECLSKNEVAWDFYKYLHRFRNWRDRSADIVVSPGIQAEEELREVQLPGACVSLLDLPTTHAANVYLRSRGYDVQELVELYQLCYCVDAPHEYRNVQGRIIIPISMNDVLVGWQGRYVGELDWKNSRIPKSYNLPHMKRRQILYNYDRASQSPFVVLTEGPTSAWRVGPEAVALLGKTLSRAQLELLAKQWSVAIILLDGDAAGQDASQAIYDDLGGYIKCVHVKLPAGRDPGDSEQEWLWELIWATAASDGINLGTLEKKKNDNDNTTTTRGCSATNPSNNTGGNKRIDVGAGGELSDSPAGCARYATARSGFYKAG